MPQEPAAEAGAASSRRRQPRRQPSPAERPRRRRGGCTRRPSRRDRNAAQAGLQAGRNGRQEDREEAGQAGRLARRERQEAHHQDARRRGRRRLAGTPARTGTRGPRPRPRPTLPQHAFSLPTEPIVHEVLIPETITVANLAQKMSVKAAEVDQGADEARHHGHHQPGAGPGHRDDRGRGDGARRQARQARRSGGLPRRLAARSRLRRRRSRAHRWSR